MKILQSLTFYVFILTTALLFLSILNNYLDIFQDEMAISNLLNINNFFFYGITALTTLIIYMVIKFKR